MLRSRAFAPALILATAFVFALGGCSEDKELRIERIEPKSGEPVGDGTLHIYGNGFQAGGAKSVKVYFDDALAPKVSIVSDDEITVRTPSGVDGQTVDLHLIFEDGSEAKFEEAYTYEKVERQTVDDLVKDKEKKKD